MKKFLCAAALCAVGLCSAVTFGGCKAGAAYVEYTLSEGGDYYIVSGVSGDKLGLKSYEIPAEYSATGDGEKLPVKEIGYEAFFNCYSLGEVTLPDTIEKIGVRAFAKCSFSHFIIPESVTEIGFGAFGMCSSLTEITVPVSVTKLGDLAFMGCSSLEKAVVKANITELGDRTFFNSTAAQGNNYFSNTKLKEVWLPASLQKLEVVYYDGRLVSPLDGNAITAIYFAGSEKQWNEDVHFYRMVEKEGKEGVYEEQIVEKSKFIKNPDIMHFDVEF